MASSNRHYALDGGPTPEAVGSIRDQIAVQAYMVSILSVLGFSPTARARLGLAKVTTVSKLEQLRQQARPDRV